jgi:hypothetical protein
MSTATKYPPIYMLSDFKHFHTGLEFKINNFNRYLRGAGYWKGQPIPNHDGYDGRISVNNLPEYTLALNAGYADYNGDSFLDEYDLFLAEFDTNRDRQLTKAEFTDPVDGLLYDAELFDAIDSISGPRFNEDRDEDRVLDPGEDLNGNGVLDVDPPRAGYKDGRIDNRDGYAKIRGQITLATTETAWLSNLAPKGQVIQDMITGPIASPDPTQPAIKFGVTNGTMIDISPENFEQCTLNYKARTASAGGTAVRSIVLRSSTTQPSGTISNVILSPNDKNDGFVDEKTPAGSASWQARYQRPRFTNVTFTNVQIPKGLNAMFDNCTFRGVTYVDMTRNITRPGSTSITFDKNDGMTWSKRMKGTATFSNTTLLTATNSRGFEEGNNLHFRDCTFEGPLTGGYATAYTHFTNSWEFTGATIFKNQVDQTATLVAPQTNIELGSFKTPSLSPSTLIGVVVAGNIDIRGNTTIDGSLVVTGDGAGNTTLAYFGDNDGATNPGADIDGGYGKLVVRFNPLRTLPDGINSAVDLAPDITTYREGN